MHNTKSDKLPEEVMNAHAEFQMHLHGKGPFPMIYFSAFFEAAVHYIESIKNSPMIRRDVASAINALPEMLALKSYHAPGQAITDADRLECMLFNEYDPYFEGDKAQLGEGEPHAKNPSTKCNKRGPSGQQYRLRVMGERPKNTVEIQQVW